VELDFSPGMEYCSIKYKKEGFMEGTKINILNDEVIAKISAGEVVERPASVVKELVENSIDAGSDSIDIEIQDAGQSLVRVADNGEGMTSSNAKIACLQHTTSKIWDIDDLNHITTLGFRGEALSSIAAVSRMDMVTRAQADGSGTQICLENGQIREVRPAGRSRGTTIEVRDLFYNVPARLKFMKKRSTELAEIVRVVGRFIVAHPAIEFKLTHGDRCLLHAAKDMEMIERIHLVLGGDVSEDMVDVSGGAGEYKITGYVSRPSSTRKDRRAQMFFVNGRYVRSRILSDAAGNAYRSLLERGRYPAVVLFLAVSPGEVDVNVHPTKLQIKFDDERTLRDAVNDSIKERFGSIKQADAEFQADLSSPAATGAGSPEEPVFAEAPDVQTEFSYKRTGGGGSPQYTERKNMFQVGGCYIVQLTLDNITITDQHAAHERVLYEFFSKASEDDPAEVQNLLFPVRMDLSAAESVIMEKVIENFRVLGFYVEPFGERSFIVQAAPSILKDRDIKTVIYDVLADLASYDLARIDLADELVKLTSCRAAIKAGDVLGREEMTSVLDQLHRCALPFTCPHGRPTTLTITIEELEKRFRRK
jgi:DNA mismatch repair protein MutL